MCYRVSPGNRGGALPARLAAPSGTRRVTGAQRALGQVCGGNGCLPPPAGNGARRKAPGPSPAQDSRTLTSAGGLGPTNASPSHTTARSEVKALNCQEKEKGKPGALRAGKGEEPKARARHVTGAPRDPAPRRCPAQWALPFASGMAAPLGGMFSGQAPGPPPPPGLPGQASLLQAAPGAPRSSPSTLVDELESSFEVKGAWGGCVPFAPFS